MIVSHRGNRIDGHLGVLRRPYWLRGASEPKEEGYANAILAKGLQTAKELGICSVLCVYDEDNIASEKTILKNGGAFENTLFDSEEGVNVKRF